MMHRVSPSRKGAFHARFLERFKHGSDFAAATLKVEYSYFEGGIIRKELPLVQPSTKNPPFDQETERKTKIQQWRVSFYPSAWRLRLQLVMRLSISMLLSLAALLPLDRQL